MSKSPNLLRCSLVSQSRAIRELHLFAFKTTGKERWNSLPCASPKRSAVAFLKHAQKNTLCKTRVTTAGFCPVPISGLSRDGQVIKCPFSFSGHAVLRRNPAELGGEFDPLSFGVGRGSVPGSISTGICTSVSWRVVTVAVEPLANNSYYSLD